MNTPLRKEARFINPGKVFEYDIKKSIPKDVYYFRIKDPAQSFSHSDITRFSPPNEFDIILYKYPVMFALELKSTISHSISFATNNNDKGKSIKYSQINALYYASQFNIKAGFLLNFRQAQSTYWIHISDFMSFYNNTDKKSINENDLKNNNGILIPQIIKKTHYIYDLLPILNTIKEERED